MTQLVSAGLFVAEMQSTAAHCVITRNARLSAAATCSHAFSPQATSSLAILLQHSRVRASSRRISILSHAHDSRLQLQPQLRLLSTRRLCPQTHTGSPSKLSSPAQAKVTTRTMASDSDYMAFLNKANSQREAGSGQPHTQSSAPSQQIRTKSIEPGAAVPGPLKEVDAFYTSETDEPFEPVVLKWEGAAQGTWPASDQFAALIASTPSPNLSQAIETLSSSSFDPRDQYTGVIKAVQAAAASDPKNVDVKVYRVEVGHNRVEYWIVALDAAAGTIVGMKAKAIES